ncbi:chromosome partition protein MukB [Psittacicella hinzii]|nr:chromosome partition protein MukB [Psittacicella hinzii]
MLNRGKFSSLIMMNWNGFFARKYDLDELVTTLSGGNGAGKSTTMAAFITALIPDLSLLHFRNTTEAGSTSSSRDRGLHGKLKSGTCYAALECKNSRGEIILFGVRLQQVAGRDKKVDLKLFSISGIAPGTECEKLFLQGLGDGKAKIISLNELKAVCEGQSLSFKTYSSIGDYHAKMFDDGFLPKRLRTPQDRSRFYRLIEASLYGGISSTITKSLREYLLPENGAVKRAFQDMEAAILENRMTLNKIEQTQADRNFFRELVDAAIDYVGADYVYQHNNRLDLVKGLLAARKHLHTLEARASALTQAIAAYNGQQGQLQANYDRLQQEYEKANEYHSLLVSANRLQGQYNDELAKVTSLSEEVEVAEVKLEDLTFTRATLQDDMASQEGQMERLRRELSDTQTALDQRQTRQVQYKQAVQKLADFNQQLTQAKAKLSDELGALGTNLDVPAVTNAAQLLQQELAQVNQKYSTLNNAKQVSANAAQDYQKALKALEKLAGKSVDVNQRYSLAQNLVRGAVLKRSYAERVNSLEHEYAQLAKRREQAANSSSQVHNLQQQLGESFSSRAELSDYFNMHQEAYVELDATKNAAKDELSDLNMQLSIATSKLNSLNEQRFPYLKAQDELASINSKLETPITDMASARQTLEHYLALSNQQGLTVQNLESKKEVLQEQIYKIEKQGMGVDQQLQYIAQDLNGVLLSEIYDDISLDDACYYSALYGPARDAIVVPTFNGIEEKLAQLQDVPADLYLIEADFNDFNENMFDSRLLDDKNVLVRINEHQLRYSNLQEVTTFGKAAREKFIENAREELKEVLYQLTTLEKEYFNHKAFAESLTTFITQYGDIAFRENPEIAINELVKTSSNVERQITQLRRTIETTNAQIADHTRKTNILYQLLNVFSEQGETDVEADYQRVRSELNQAKEAQRYLSQYASELQVLEEKVAVLQYPVDQDTDLEAELASTKELQQTLVNLSHLADEVVSRKEHFAYKDLGELEGDELGNKLRQQLDTLEAAYSQAKAEYKVVNTEFEQQQQQLFKYRAELETAKATLEQLSAALAETGTNITAGAVEAAKAKAADLLAQANSVKEQMIDAKNTHQQNQERLAGLESQITAAKRDFSFSRANVADNKAKWRLSQEQAKEHQIQGRLFNPGFRALSNEELRSKSDRALGTLRTLISENEYLRDALKASEDSRRPHLKVAFFIAVYQHLRERIRQDVLTTNDPIEAIEQMEIQLSMLSSKLEEREKSLVISAGDVASILDKTIQREQNRIWQLNQGLQNMSFGQVKSVRLTATYRESHAALLNALREGRDKHADLFNNSEISFTEALAKLYQRTNQDVDFGQRNFQTVGEELLDYRNYIDLGIEVYRGSDGWLKAESGALSTGEAIGTGMSILLMVVQSWEEESKRIRAKNLLPCRLLFLDEAARLDSKSIATLFELCERQQMQLLIAAPENIAPDNGTTYKLVRTVSGDREFVNVVGLRGFGSRASQKAQEAAQTASQA